MRDVIGHRRLLDPLAAHALRGEVAHAYGLYGPASVGKRTAALRLAQTLECDRGVAGGCGACLACRKVERGTHPDVRVITRPLDRTQILIDQVREMQADLALRPLEGHWRVVIVDDAGEVNDVAQDALLKTLEEPPAHAVLLLVTTTPAKLHETVRSRLRPLAFRLVAADEIAAGLEARGLADARRFALAAAGRPGVAVTLAAGGGPRAERAKIEDELYRLIASGLTDRFGWAAELNEISDDPRHGRKRTAAIRTRFEHWAELLRDAAVAARGDLARPLRPEQIARTRRLASSVPAADLLAVVTLVTGLQRDLGDYANARTMLELFALRLPYSTAVAA